MTVDEDVMKKRQNEASSNPQHMGIQELMEDKSTDASRPVRGICKNWRRSASSPPERPRLNEKKAYQRVLGEEWGAGSS